MTLYKIEYRVKATVAMEVRAETLEAGVEESTKTLTEAIKKLPVGASLNIRPVRFSKAGDGKWVVCDETAAKHLE